MRRTVLLLALLPAFTGCQTHLFLRDNSARTTATLTDLNYQQVLDNVARFTANPASLPSLAVFTAGTVSVSDQKAVGGNAIYSPTLTFQQQGGGALPILSLLFSPSGSRSLTENWSMVPVTDIDNVRRMRCAFQLLVLNGGETSNCFACVDLLNQFYLGEVERMECLIPTGWYGVGCEKAVPKHACYVGHYCDTYVWVMPEGLEGLSRFTMTVLELASGKPHAPMKTVVRTYKADGTLDSTQVTTTEIDKEALDRMKKEGKFVDRPQRSEGPAINPGMFFLGD